MSGDWLKTVESQIQSNFSTSTTEVTIVGVVNEALSQEQIVQGVAQLAASSTALSVKLSHLTVEITANRAQASADAIVEVATQNRTDRERRHVTLSLQQQSGKFRIVGVEASASIVNQPEPRP